MMRHLLLRMTPPIAPSRHSFAWVINPTKKKGEKETKFCSPDFAALRRRTND
jgi:hypothetical protein